MECVFSQAPSAKSCYVSVIGVTSMNKTLVKNSPNDVTVQGCIDNLPAGNYTVYVYDVENDIPLTSILPAITLRDIVINYISTTSKLYNILLHCYYEHYGMVSMLTYLVNCNIII